MLLQLAEISLNKTGPFGKGLEPLPSCGNGFFISINPDHDPLWTTEVEDPRGKASRADSAIKVPPTLLADQP
jgi:hypothetical protein